jgi:hypothetical protein
VVNTCEGLTCPVNYVCTLSSSGPSCTVKPCTSDGDCDCGPCMGDGSAKRCGPRLSICIHTNGGAQGAAGGSMGGGGVTGSGGGRAGSSGGIDAGSGHLDGG